MKNESFLDDLIFFFYESAREIFACEDIPLKSRNAGYWSPTHEKTIICVVVKEKYTSEWIHRNNAQSEVAIKL